MAKGEIVISETNCLGCGYCTKFCPHGCIEIAADKYGSQGLPLAVFVQPERCNACAVCAWMCPHLAIEVYRYVEPARSAARGRR